VDRPRAARATAPQLEQRHDVAKVPTVSGPALALAPGTENFVSQSKYDLGFWANRMLRREYRPPIVVPENV
jgi:hypothetical protein